MILWTLSYNNKVVVVVVVVVVNRGPSEAFSVILVCSRSRERFTGMSENRFD